MGPLEGRIFLTGHPLRQSWQSTHSAWRLGACPAIISRAGAHCVGQVVSHFLHPTHPSTGFTRQKLIQLNGASNAPIGHSTRQNPRRLTTTMNKTATNIPNLTRVLRGKGPPSPPIRPGRVACRAETGQPRQNDHNVSSPNQKGVKTTVTTRRTYLMYFVQRGRVSFRPGIL